jgi:nucleotide-binding universal stress UspA family protein
MYRKVLVPLDGSKLAECVLPHLDSLIKGGGVEDTIFVRVPEPVYIPIAGDDVSMHGSLEDYQQLESQSRVEAQRYLNNLVSTVRYSGVNIRSEVLIEGKTADRIADYAIEKGVDLIIIATHGRSGVSKWVWGSVADRILRSACVPVLMVRAPGCVPGI